MDKLYSGSCQLPEQMSSDSVRTSLVDLQISCVYTSPRGWDDLFNKCGENLNFLTAMKMSPHYKGEILVPCRDPFF